MMSVVLLAALACTHRDTGMPAKPHDTDTGVAPDSHPADTDSSREETDTGETDSHDTADSADSDSDTNIDTAPPPCDRSLGWKYVAAGYEQTCGIHTDGCAECWGRGEAESHPELDTAWLYEWHGEDRPPPGDYASISMIAILTDDPDPSTPNACGIMADGSITCWGSDETGINDAPAGSFVDVAVWPYTASAIATDGSAYQWGSEGSAPAGSFLDVEGGFDALFLLTDGTLLQTYPNGTPHFDAPAGTYIDIGLGEWYGCALKTDGSILCWDQFDPENAEFEDMTTSAPTGPFVDVCVANTSLGCALDAAGTVQCWPNASEWTAPTDESFTQLACGAWHACGLTPDNRIVCWGWDSYGETSPPT